MICGLHAALRERAAVERPIRVGLIGAGAFGGMFIRQAVRVPGIAIVAVADLDVIRAATSLLSAGLDRARVAYSNPVANGRVLVTDDVEDLLGRDDLDLIVEATGDPLAAVRHIRHAFAAGKDVVNVTVEADALVGPALATEARALGRTYSFAYGDQPALICEMVDWARTNGFEVVCAGKGTLYQPGFEFTSPDSVWARYGIDTARAEASGYDRRMFTSFVDGTKSAIEMAAVSAATGLLVPDNGLQFPAAGVRELATVLRPRGRGGQLAKSGSVEVVSSVNRDGTAVMEDLRWGVFVVIEAPDAEATCCFRDYGLVVDDSGRYAALWRPNHLVGMELITSVASVGLFGRPTGVPVSHLADVVAVAKRDLPEAMEIDGEGGYTVFGRLTSAESAHRQGALPIGLSRGLRTTRHVSAGDVLTWDDVDESTATDILALRASMYLGKKAGEMMPSGVRQAGGFVIQKETR